nr:extensin-like [Camelus dromedarius]
MTLRPPPFHYSPFVLRLESAVRTNPWPVFPRPGPPTAKAGRSFLWDGHFSGSRGPSFLLEVLSFYSSACKPPSGSPEPRPSSQDPIPSRTLDGKELPRCGYLTLPQGPKATLSRVQIRSVFSSSGSSLHSAACGPPLATPTPPLIPGPHLSETPMRECHWWSPFPKPPSPKTLLGPGFPPFSPVPHLDSGGNVAFPYDPPRPRPSPRIPDPVPPRPGYVRKCCLWSSRL